MRKLCLFLLLAGAAAPALAAIDEDGDRAARRAERQAAAASEQSQDRPTRAERRAAASERAEIRAERAERAERARSANDADRISLRERRAQRNAAVGETLANQSDGNESIRNSRRVRRDADGGREAVTETQVQAGGSLTPRQRRIRTIPDTQPNTTQPNGSVETRHRRDYRDGRYQRWTNHWRNDRRYDWRRHRDRHRSIFRLGRYYDPFGWNYRRFNIGWNFWPSHYSSRYWLNDPWHYRLPPAYGPYRWVRYWDDALLVNIYTGEVVDVMHNFFW